MTNYPTNTKHNTSTNNTSNSCCFTGIFKRLICTGNLPTHPSPPDNNNQTIPQKPKKNNVENQVNLVKSQVHQTQSSYNSPSIIAKLMGLETFPINNNEKSTTLDSLFRSKSLNSLNFLPDFDPYSRASFHRRARTSASFHEQGHKFLVKIDENFESNEIFVQESKVGNESRRVRKKEEKYLVLKERNKENGGKSRIKISENKKKYEERYTSGAKTSCSRSRELKTSVNNNNGCNFKEREKCAIMQKRRLVNSNKDNKVGSKVLSKKKIGNKQVMSIEANQSDGTLLSPVLVLDDHKEVHKGDGGQISSTLRRKSTPKIRNHDNLQQKKVPKSKQNYEETCSTMEREQEVVIKAEEMAVDYFVEMLGCISKLAEQHTIQETNWAANYMSFKVHFVEDLCLHLGQDMLDLLLDELLHDIIMMLL